jgi:hypothetical protein
VSAIPVRWLTVFLDFPADSFGDPERLATRHAAAGARILAVLPHQTEMADPVGRRYLLSTG